MKGRGNRVQTQHVVFLTLNIGGKGDRVRTQHSEFLTF